MDTALQAQVDRCDELAERLGTEIVGEHVLDAIAQLGLRLDEAPAFGEVLAAQHDYAVQLGGLLPELAVALIRDALIGLDLVLAPAGEINVASLAWLALLDESES